MLRREGRQTVIAEGFERRRRERENQRDCRALDHDVEPVHVFASLTGSFARGPEDVPRALLAEGAFSGYRVDAGNSVHR